MKKSVLLALGLFSTQVFSAEYIVKLNSQKGMDSLFENKSLTQVEDMKISFGTYAKITVDDKAVIENLKQNPNVQYVEENRTYSAFPIEQVSDVKEAADPKFSQQWGLKNTGLNSGGLFSPGRRGEDINALKAWELTKGDEEIKIAVIDTGVDYNHPDLKDNYMVNEAELNGEEGVDDDGNGYVDDVYGYDFANNDNNPMDGHGHGTHCAGVIAASHDSTGIAGVMSKAKILGIKFLTDRGSGTLEAAVKSIDYAIKREVDIMSNSWGGGGFNQALFDAIEAAHQAGIVFVAAAGNSRRNNDTTETYPANYEVDNVISVGAMDGAGKKASFSNYGAKKVHVFAPGVNILSTVQNNAYKKMSGTSMACPHVSGIAGLVLAQNPDMSPSELRDLLVDSSVETSRLRTQSLSKGRVDAYRALRNER